MKILPFLLSFSCLISSHYFGFAQTYNKIINPWKSTKIPTGQNLPTKKMLPKNYQSIQLNIANLNIILKEAPLRFSEAATLKEVLLSIPYPDGSFHNFKIVETSVLHPDLGKQFPNIRSYEGIGIDDITARLRFDWSPYGFHGMILSSKQDAIFIENYEDADLENYFVFYKKDAAEDALNLFNCGVKEMENSKTLQITQNRSKENCSLKTYRIAIACTGQYGQYHGGTVEGVLAAMNTTMTRVNGIFENDVAVSFQILPNTIDLIFLDSIHDPYETSDIYIMAEQNQIVIDSIIGEENYDLGHLFNMETTSPRAIGRNGICKSGTKAMGVTGITPPEGHRFDVDYVTHEIGHQLGATHTYDGNQGLCNGSIYGGVEVGSGSTIMGYAGICETDDVQSFSDPYFHAVSIAEMHEQLNNETTSNCAEIIDLERAIPLADAGQNYSIPISTPFILESETISFDSSLTYCWEQMDTPNFIGLYGPLFRSIPPNLSNKRFFPALENLVNNDTPWETLPTESRKIKFRVTVRENNIGGGCTSSDDLEISVTDNAGPFTINQPNDAIQWSVGGTEIVTWEVANTDLAPINTKEVTILLSTDGGLTYPTLLLENAPNTGEAIIVVPNITSKEARVMVMAKDNIFFDISDTNFEIQESTTNIKEHLAASFNWSVSPNPFQDYFVVDLIDLPLNKKVLIQVTDVLGRIVFEQQLDAKKKVQVATQQLKRGIYLVGLIDTKTKQPIGKFKRLLH